MKRAFPFLLPLLLFAALVAALAVGVTRAHHAGFALHLGGSAPVTDLPLMNESAARYRSADWRGRPHLVNFFASWCVPCRAEHPNLMELAQAGIPVIGIAFKDKPDAVKAFLQEAGDPFIAVADDAGGHAGIDWGVTGVPESFLIDAQGVTRFHQAGPLTDDDIAQIESLWREAAP